MDTMHSFHVLLMKYLEKYHSFNKSIIFSTEYIAGRIKV